MSTSPSGVLNELKQKLSPLGGTLLEEFWTSYLDDKEWPGMKVVHSRHDKSLTRAALLPLTGAVVYEHEDHTHGNRYALTAIGALLSKRGSTYRKLYRSYFEYQRKIFLTEPTKKTLTAREIATALKLSDKDLETLKTLLSLRPFYDQTVTADTWAMRVLEEVEDFPREGPLDAAFESVLLKRTSLSAHVYKADQVHMVTPPLAQLGDWAQPFSAPPPAVSTGTVDALKRRYQVFVSSTYKDLIDEREEVMRALLETKCIPVGMELFPASSNKLMDVIKRLIETSDYYIVIIAGRYGSLNEQGISYTEAEFDYARSIKRPVIGFFHDSLDSIPGGKLEKDDKARAQLSAFAAKVKGGGSTCRPWSTAKDLGSAVKSSILNELEFNLQPGWIRADTVASSDLVEKLKQRVADLEEKLKRRPALQAGELVVTPKTYEIALKVNYYPPRAAGAPEADLPSNSTDAITVTRTLDQMLAELSEQLEQPVSAEDLWLEWSNILGIDALKQINERIGADCEYSDTELDFRQFDRLLNSLIAKKYVRKDLSRSRDGPAPMYQLTPAGIQRAAELKAL